MFLSKNHNLLFLNIRCYKKHLEV